MLTNKAQILDATAQRGKKEAERAMAAVFILTLLLSLLLAHAKDPSPESQFFQQCPPTSCGSGSGSISIRFPLRLETSPPSCGLKGIPPLTCSADNETLHLALQSLPHHHRTFNVTHIDYRNSLITIAIGSGFGSLSSPCPLRNLTTFDSLKTLVFTPDSIMDVSLVRCSGELMDPGTGEAAGPIPCLSGPGYSVYAVDTSESMDVIPDGCVVVNTGGQIPYRTWSDMKGVLDQSEKTREVNLKWYVPELGSNYYGDKCGECEGEGRLCGIDNWDDNQIVCQEPGHHGLVLKIITGTSITGFVILVATTLIFFYIFRLSQKEKETRLKVERFLATYKTTKPTRYTFSGIKKITKRFRHKLGQGGFGSVYKGELPNGIPVAVKMLERSKGEADEFINEVTTMGRIHHVNVVRLLGFCSEGARHALIYEFMPNESLEKYIFSKQEPLSMEKLQAIAIGIARGIEYLHQGCDQRILHFDIKPHNILLDHNFNPKISDFGLAKLCSRDQSIVTMTAARGTMGYIAPEIYSRNFGTVSYKSDVYSFGMLLLEMASGKRNIDPEMDNQDEVYFPEWVYERLVGDEDIGLTNENGYEEGIMKTLVIVALWCIQWSPNDRPTMTRVIQLLMGNLESLQIPPKPFVSASDQDDVASVDIVVDSAHSSGNAQP